MQRVWWSVEVEDDRGTTTTSAPAWFETGLLSPDDWRAQWIEAEDPLAKADRAAGLRWVWSPTALASRPHAFRLAFDAPEESERAGRSGEHTSQLQSIMRPSYAVFWMKTQ